MNVQIDAPPKRNPRRKYKDLAGPAPNRLREIRIARDLTQTDLANHLGVPLAVVNQAERERTSALGTENWIRLARLLGVDFDFLYLPPEKTIEKS